MPLARASCLEIATLTGEAIQSAAERYLDTGNYVKVTLLPGSK